MNAPSDLPGEARVLALLDRYHVLLEQGRTVSPDEICRHDPEMPDRPGISRTDLWEQKTPAALAVEDRQKRHELLHKVKEQGWGERELQRAIQQLKGSKRGGGRPRKEMHSQGTLADDAELLRLTELWLKFDEKVWCHSRVADHRGLDGHALLALNRMLEDAVDKLKRLQSRARGARRLAESLLNKPS